MFSTTFSAVFEVEELLLALIYQLDVQSIFRLGRTCKQFQRVPNLAWDGNTTWGQFMDDKDKLRDIFDRTGATATGGALIRFLGREAPSKWSDWKILINHYEHAKEMEQLFLAEGFKAVELDEPIDSKCFLMACKLTNQCRNGGSSVIIITCHGSNEQQAVLMTNNTTEAVTLTSKRVVCMFPSLGLLHQCAYPFDGIPDRTRTNGYDCIASHVLPGQYPLAKATRSELGRKRLLGDEQCFIIPLCADPGGKSVWSMEIRPKGGVMWSFDGGTVTSPWRSAKSIMAIFLQSRNGGEASPSRLVRLVERGDNNAMMRLIQNRAD
ncbi:hypothetical protein, variant [Verruconis gallopava]|uniref:F-box domain-containing protein n=1 Tax=Verruconis gallopava TaxID=253628 RepID=A0A0D1ZW81_9PEZI|nr:uncharacterized protein PV09_09483 [Verruconis gallopava]XP_016208622.1 hypothetical protein, variant [Verruconis gallopava]KIV98751.1 hypothetical protein PV09_09483 [Verruconis gallopava]KIV98752.1 hypothetical protein, variant [Verruconis gallopava]